MRTLLLLPSLDQTALGVPFEEQWDHPPLHATVMIPAIRQRARFFMSHLRICGWPLQNCFFCLCAGQDVQRYISGNRRLLHAVYLLYAEPSDDGALITLEHFRYVR